MSRTRTPGSKRIMIREGSPRALGMHGLHLGLCGTMEASLPSCPGLGLCRETSMPRCQKSGIYPEISVLLDELMPQTKCHLELLQLPRRLLVTKEEERANLIPLLAAPQVLKDGE